MKNNFFRLVTVIHESFKEASMCTSVLIIEEVCNAIVTRAPGAAFKTSSSSNHQEAWLISVLKKISVRKFFGHLLTLRISKEGSAAVDIHFKIL